MRTAGRMIGREAAGAAARAEGAGPSSPSLTLTRSLTRADVRAGATFVAPALLEEFAGIYLSIYFGLFLFVYFPSPRREQIEKSGI